MSYLVVEMAKTMIDCSLLALSVAFYFQECRSPESRNPVLLPTMDMRYEEGRKSTTEDQTRLKVTCEPFASKKYPG